jgi:hypothetical protein
MRDHLRHVRREHSAAWERVGWKVISEPLLLWSPPGFEGHVRDVHLVVIEWVGSGSPVKPATAD